MLTNIIIVHAIRFFLYGYTNDELLKLALKSIHYTISTDTVEYIMIPVRWNL